VKFYIWLERTGWPRSYLGKILLVAFVGVHIPLIGAVGYLLLTGEHPLADLVGVLLTLLGATLVGTIATMASMYALLSPVREAANAMNRYLRDRTVPQLPIGLRDEAGTLLSNVQEGVTRMDAALDAATGQAEQASRQLREKFQLLARMSHEFRTPLNHIIGFAEMMSSEALGPLGQPAYKGYAGDIGQSGGRLLDLLQSVLELSAAESGELPLHPKASPLREAIDSATARAHLMAMQYRVSIRASIARDATVYADQRALKQILLHGLQAAIETAGEGRSVAIRVAAATERAEVEISHDGPSWRMDDLPPELVAATNSRAAATDSAGIRSSSPLALRLSLVRSLVQACGGALSAYASDAGGGLRISLPTAAGAHA
jgi:signal transduction histidine kinase